MTAKEDEARLARFKAIDEQYGERAVLHKGRRLYVPKAWLEQQEEAKEYRDGIATERT